MTGAGAAEVAYAVEDSYQTLPGSPTWKQPGLDVEVTEASLENALIRARQPDTPIPQGSRAGNLEGAYNVSFSQDTDQDIHELVFPKNSNTNLASGADTAPTATWYLSADVIGSTEERFLAGAAVESVTWNYNQGQKNTVDLTVIYGDEPEVGGSHGSAPGSISQPAKDDIVMWHETDFEISSSQLSAKLQTLSLTISGLARFRRGQQRAPVDAVIGAYEPTLTVEAVLEDDTQQQLAYGSSTAQEPLDTIDETDMTLIFDPASNLNILGAQPNSYSWSQLVGEEDVTDPTDYQVSEVSVA